MALPNCFKPKKNYSLHRVGKNYDGGYLVSKETILKSDTLLSLGINDDWSFEKHFKKINSEAKIFCYDDKPILKYLFKKAIIDVVFFINHLNFLFGDKLSIADISVASHLSLLKFPNSSGETLKGKGCSLYINDPSLQNLFNWRDLIEDQVTQSNHN